MAQTLAVAKVRMGDVEKKGVKCNRKYKRTSIGKSHNTRKKNKTASRERKGR